MSDHKTKTEITKDETAEDVLSTERRRLVGKSKYVIPAILAVSVTDLAKAQEDIVLSSPPGLPNP